MSSRYLFTPPPEHARHLDGLRALAILAVLCFHSMIQVPDLAFELRDTLMGRLLLRGGVGVDLFFVLSGYLIGGQLLREGLASGRIRFGDFYIKRFFRIFPAYWAVLVLICAVLVWQPFYDALLRGVTPSEAMGSAWSNFLYLNNYTGSRLMPWGWSLAVEEHFYLVIPLLLSLVVLRLPRGRATVVLWVLLFLPWVTRLLAFRGLGIDPIVTGGTPDEQATRATELMAWMDAVFVPSHNRYDSLMVGVLCAWAEQTSSGVRRRWRGWGGVALTALSLLVIAGYLLGKGGKPVGPVASAVLVGPLALAFGGILQHTLYRERSWLRRLLGWRGFHPVARVSYGMYLLHPFLIAALGALGVHGALSTLGDARLAVLAVLAVNLAVAYGAALGMFVLLEWPMMLLRSRILARRRATVDALEKPEEET